MYLRPTIVTVARKWLFARFSTRTRRNRPRNAPDALLCALRKRVRRARTYAWRYNSGTHSSEGRYPAEKRRRANILRLSEEDLSLSVENYSLFSFSFFSGYIRARKRLFSRRRILSRRIISRARRASQRRCRFARVTNARWLLKRCNLNLSTISV